MNPRFIWEGLIPWWLFIMGSLFLYLVRPFCSALLVIQMSPGPWNHWPGELLRIAEGKGGKMFFVCLCFRVCVFAFWLFLCLRFCLFVFVRFCMCVFMLLCFFFGACVFVFVFLCVCTFVFVCLRFYVCVFVCAFLCSRVCVFVFVFAFLCLCSCFCGFVRSCFCGFAFACLFFRDNS